MIWGFHRATLCAAASEATAGAEIGLSVTLRDAFGNAAAVAASAADIPVLVAVTPPPAADQDAWLRHLQAEWVSFSAVSSMPQAGSVLVGFRANVTGAYSVRAELRCCCAHACFLAMP